MNNAAKNIHNDYAAIPVMVTPRVGLVLSDRRFETDTGKGTVSLVYWGKDAEPKLTVNVDFDNNRAESFYIISPDEYVLTEYEHALISSDTKRIPAEELGDAVYA